MRLRYLLTLTVCASLAALPGCHDTEAPGVHHGPLPEAQVGSSTYDVAPASYDRRWLDGVGVMRTFCSFSHASHDDPIVAPGNDNATHLHSFFGNTSTDENTTDPASVGDSTCTGGIANRTSYWVPAMLDLGSDPDWFEIITTFNDFGQHTGWQDQYAIDGNLALNVYYKTGYKGVPSDSVVTPPPNLRMIAGNLATATGPTPDSHTAYNCIHPRNLSESLFGSFDHIPSLAEDSECTVGNLMVMIVVFPQCWNGQDLDSPDHRSHMAYAIPPTGCPASHPVALPEVSYHVRYTITEENFPTSNWRLSSDMYDGTAGYSGHADWWMGWDQATFDRIVSYCYQGGWDCIGELLGPNPTTGVREELVNTLHD